MPNKLGKITAPNRSSVAMMSGNGLQEYRAQIKKLDQTKKITGAMKLVAASKVKKT